MKSIIWMVVGLLMIPFLFYFLLGVLSTDRIISANKLSSNLQLLKLTNEIRAMQSEVEVHHLNLTNIFQTSKQVKKLRRLNGFENGYYLKELNCGGYSCVLEAGTNRTADADLVMLNERDVEHYHLPPSRQASQLWAFLSKEAQTHLYSAPLVEWNGFFNYSATFVRETDGTYLSFREEVVPRSISTKWDFAKVHRLRSPKALWLVSDCILYGPHKRVTSARVEYMFELSKYLPVDVFTRNGRCRKMLGSLVKEKVNGEPRLQDYIFYLAFENSLCKDYISEKFWKVLQASGPTIPVALGGLSIEEYEYVAPPNSFIHVRNFTSAQALASHLRLVAERDESFNYYHQWRNQFYIKPKRHVGVMGDFYCHFCKLAYQRPRGVWQNFSEDFGKHKCLDVSQAADFCSYYNLTHLRCHKKD